MVIVNKIIPFGHFLCFNFFTILFTKRELNEVELRHEAIHTAQMKELLFIPFYILYLLEYLIKFLFVYKFKANKTYCNVSFEREAYAGESSPTYLDHRKHYAWWKLIWF